MVVVVSNKICKDLGTYLQDYYNEKGQISDPNRWPRPVRETKTAKIRQPGSFQRGLCASHMYDFACDD